MNTLHKMPDHMQQTMVVTQRRAQKTYTEQAHQGQNGMLPAQVEARVAYEKMPRSRRSRDNLHRHHKKTLLQKTEALGKYVETVTMRAEALATTQVDFFKALIERHEEAQKHLNELAAQLSQQNTATRSTQGKPHSAERRNKHTPGAQSLLFFPTSCQSPQSLQ